jgi:hypothetical protein
MMHGLANVKFKRISGFETLETTNPETESHIPEDLSSHFSTLQ